MGKMMKGLNGWQLTGQVRMWEDCGNWFVLMGDECHEWWKKN